MLKPGLLSVWILLAGLCACAPGNLVDAHVAAVVVEKLEAGESHGIIRAVTTEEPPRVVVFSLREDPPRPL